MTQLQTFSRLATVINYIYPSATAESDQVAARSRLRQHTMTSKEYHFLEFRTKGLPSIFGDAAHPRRCSIAFLEGCDYRNIIAQLERLRVAALNAERACWTHVH